MSSTANFYFKTSENEQIETSIHIRQDNRSAILGHLKNTEGAPVVDALVLLFDGDEDSPSLLGQTFTDESGQFYFGPLEPNRLHHIKIYKNSTKLRELEICTDA